jgi:hypothetical protein
MFRTVLPKCCRVCPSRLKLNDKTLSGITPPQYNLG